MTPDDENTPPPGDAAYLRKSERIKASLRIRSQSKTISRENLDQKTLDGGCVSKKRVDDERRRHRASVGEMS